MVDNQPQRLSITWLPSIGNLHLGTASHSRCEMTTLVGSKNRTTWNPSVSEESSATGIMACEYKNLQVLPTAVESSSCVRSSQSPINFLASRHANLPYAGRDPTLVCIFCSTPAFGPCAQHLSIEIQLSCNSAMASRWRSLASTFPKRYASHGGASPKYADLCDRRL